MTDCVRPRQTGRRFRAGRRSVSPVFWLLAQLGSRIRPKSPPGFEYSAANLPAPSTGIVPTRHGRVRVLLQYPKEPGQACPVVMHMHGGGFVNRHPEQDLHVARTLSARLGAVVVLPDYATAPKASYPVAEEQMFDVSRWIQTSTSHWWDGNQFLLSGVSAGAKLAINVCQQLHAAHFPAPRALALIVPVSDVTRADRTSSIRRPAISPFVQRFVQWAYFPDSARRSEPLASPAHDTTLGTILPPTLILTAENDTLAHEGTNLAATLDHAGTHVEHHVYPAADHDFISGSDTDQIRDALIRMVTFFQMNDNGVASP